MRRIDWRMLRGPLGLVAGAAAIGTAVATGALQLQAEALRGYDREKNRLETVRARYRTIDEQKRQIETWLPAYRSLRAAGVIGEERRLEWIETLRAAAARVGLPSLRYRIEPRTAHEAGAGLDTGGHGAFSTVVHVEVGLLHEGDLERLFRELRSAEAGLFHIERCGIRRSGPDFVMRPGAINLSAECDLRWFTFARSEGGQ
ncbi:MAG: hypothetical protein OXC65_08530 [Thiotrichales bacterium]|nr:hypothetical protein [Thiotrichales bacterium]